MGIYIRPKSRSIIELVLAIILSLYTVLNPTIGSFNNFVKEGDYSIYKLSRVA